MDAAQSLIPISINAPILSTLLTESKDIKAPRLLLLNVQVFLSEMEKISGKSCRLADIPETTWHEILEHYDMVWLMGIYEQSNAAIEYAKALSHVFLKDYPHLDPQKDLQASPFAIISYTPDKKVASSWQEWDEKILRPFNDRGKKIILDFVPNHVALDHPWTIEHPEWFVSLPEDQIISENGYLFSSIMYKSQTTNKRKIVHGNHRWSHGYPWRDTLQLNYGSADLQQAMRNELYMITPHCNGVRCDMAHLVTSEVFLQQWSGFLSQEEKTFLQKNEFWPEAIQEVHNHNRAAQANVFEFIGEVYEDANINLLAKQGFSSLYEKTGLYDRLLNARYHDNIHEHLIGHLTYLTEHLHAYKPVMFTENHDEERAINIFGKTASSAAAVITALLPNGIFMMHHGQESGRTIKVAMQLNKLPVYEPIDLGLKKFYDKLLLLRASTLFQQGKAWIPEHRAVHPNIILQQVELQASGGAIVCTNYSEEYAEGIIHLPLETQVFVYDLMENKWFSNEEVSRNHSGEASITLLPWRSQIVFYTFS